MRKSQVGPVVVSDRLSYEPAFMNIWKCGNMITLKRPTIDMLADAIS
jgi:hypothetical protein